MVLAAGNYCGVGHFGAAGDAAGFGRGRDCAVRSLVAARELAEAYFGDVLDVRWVAVAADALGGAQRADIRARGISGAALRARVAELLAQYNRDLEMTPLRDHGFALLAAERTARNPLRTYLFVPAERIAAMWFTPRIELPPYSGKLWPAGEHWRGNPADFGVTFGFGILGFVHLALAAVGWWRCRAQLVATFLFLFVGIRTVVMTQLQTVEPRYVIECFPVIVALGALVWAMPGRRSDAVSGAARARSAVTSD